MSFLPTRILVATDGSECATLAARAAVDLSNKSGSELHVAHAWTHVPSARFETYVYTQLEEEGRRVLEEEVRRMEAAGANIAGTHLREGSTHKVIVGLAEELAAGLVVVGSRGLGPLKRFFMGSISESVVRCARCPVLVVREWPHSGFPAEIVLATDGSEESALATRAAADLSEKTGSEVHILHVERSPVMAYSGRAQQSTTSEAQKLLDDQVQRTKEAGGRVAATHLRIGEPSEEIVGLSAEIGAGLVVVGSRGLGAAKRLSLGSVSESVVRRAPCPVLVVR